MTWKVKRQKDMRLCILRFLEESPGYESGESLIQEVLDDYAHSLSRDKLRTELNWLEEQGLVELRQIADFNIATLTTRGQDVVEGNVTVPGVKRPGPRS